MNTQQIYKEALESVLGNSEEQNKLRQQAEVEQKNVEAWAQWRQLPQTIMFLNKLTTVAIVINKYTAAMCANVTSVNNDYVRARMVEANLLNELVDITSKNGQLKEHLLKEYTT